jgi:hypothetical protein
MRHGKRTRTNLIVAAALAAAALLALFLAPRAEAGQYRLAMCHGGYKNPNHKFRYEENFSDSNNDFVRSVHCGQNERGLSIDFSGTVANDKWGRWVTEAPGGLHIVGWNVGANIRDDDGVTGRVCYSRDSHPAQCTGASTGGGYDLYGNGLGYADGRSLFFRLGCFRARGCGPTNLAHIYARNIVLTIDDSIRPTINVGGAALSGGVKSGRQYLTIHSSDAQSGIRSYFVHVNGQQYAAQTLPCPGVVTDPSTFNAYRPCPLVYDTTLELNTERGPFIQGANAVHVCVGDVYTPGLDGPNLDCQDAVVEVDNSCPSSTPGGQNLAAGFGPRRDSSPTYTYGFRPPLEPDQV